MIFPGEGIGFELSPWPSGDDSAESNVLSVMLIQGREGSEVWDEATEYQFTGEDGKL